MLKTKVTKKSIIDRIINLDKETMQGKQPYLIMIDRDKTRGWRIVEHYLKVNDVRFKELFYNDYNKYLENAKLDNNIPVIVNDIPILE